MKNIRRLLAGFLILLLAAACSPGNDSIPETGDELRPALLISNQAGIDSSILVDQADSPTPAWIVIYSDANGSPGRVIGFAPVEMGTSRGVSVPIDAAAATGTLFAKLHADQGEVSVFEFPGEDNPMEVGQTEVEISFQLLAGSPQLQPESELPVEAEVLLSAEVIVPREVSIAAGGRVVWINQDTTAHTVTAEDHSFDSGILEGGQSFEFIFYQAGRYPYYCEEHGGPGGRGESGVVIVR